MTTDRKSFKREASFAWLAALGLVICFGITAGAQEGAKPKEKEKDKDALAERRDAIVETGYTRPGNIDDRFIKNGEIIPAALQGADVKKFKIMGGTVYFVVFKNTGLVEGDTFGTGMAGFDRKFRTGRSFKDSFSPRYDDKAKYLYLYQVVNDRELSPKTKVPEKGDPGIGVGVFSPKAKPPVTDDIASFALKLLVDPRYITSWGHFTGAGFAANVVDVDAAGKVVKQVVDKVEKDKEIRLAFSYLPAIVTKITHPAYRPHAQSYDLGDLEAGFGVDDSKKNLTQSKAFSELKLAAGKAGGNVAWASFADNLVKDAEQGALEPNYVQLMFEAPEERAVQAERELLGEEVTRAIFRADWDRVKSIKQGDRSVVFGFTTDLPPVASPIRIETPKGAILSESIPLSSYFTDEGTGRIPGADGAWLPRSNGADATAMAMKMQRTLPTRKRTDRFEGMQMVSFISTDSTEQAPADDDLLVQVGGANAAGLALAMGTALGQAVTPVPPAAAAPSGFSGITGGVGGMGGTMMGGGMGGFGTPAFNQGFSRQGGGFGGGGGLNGGGGTQTGTTTPQGQTQTPTQAGSQIINFNASLTNQQLQAQLQAQQQQQRQSQHNGHGHGGHGQVVPAPASLLLGLLGLPGLYFLRRRKTAAA